MFYNLISKAHTILCKRRHPQITRRISWDDYFRFVENPWKEWIRSVNVLLYLVTCILILSVSVSYDHNKKIRYMFQFWVRRFNSCYHCFWNIIKFAKPCFILCFGTNLINNYNKNCCNHFKFIFIGHMVLWLWHLYEKT